MTGVLLGMFLSAMDQMIVSTAMPQIVRDLNGLEHLSWVFTAYMLAATVIVPIYGKLSDIFGPRRFFLIGVIIFLVGSVLAGAAQSMTQLILFRAIQGLGGGAIMVNAMAVIGHIFPPHQRGKWQGVLSGVYGLASIAGPLLGGWITDHSTWRWVFYVNIPLGIIAFIVLAIGLPKIQIEVKDRSIDFLGALLITSTLIPLLLALVWGGSEYAWSSGTIIGLLGFGALSLLTFIMWERKAKEPILFLGLFKNRVFLSSVIVLFFIGMGMFGAILYIPIFAQGVTGISATNSGLIMTPMMVTMIIASIGGGILISKTGKYKIMALVGVGLTVLAMAIFTTITVETTQTGLFLRMALLGLGLGITMPIFTIAVQNAFGKERLGEVTAATQLFRSIGGTVGTAIFGGVMNAQLLTRLKGIEDNNFVTVMKGVDPKSVFSHMNSEVAQGLLNTTSQAQVKASFSQAPPESQNMLSAAFDQFLHVIKVGFSGAMDHMFLVCTILMSFALIVVFFLPEVPLKKPAKPPLEEAGLELNAELIQSDKRHEPEL